MANKMLSNIQSLTTGVSTLTQKVNELYAAVEKVSEVAQGAVSGVQGVLKNGGGYHHLNTASNRPGTGADGAQFPAGTGAMPSYQNIEQSMGTFGGASASEARGGAGGGGFTQSAAQAKLLGIKVPKLAGLAAFSGVGQIGFGLAAGAYAAMPDLNMTLSRSLGFYQAGLKAPGISRNQLERATFGAMAGGLSSQGSDALVAAILAGRGVTPGGTDYLKLTREVGGAYRYLGMENAPAAQALAGLRSGPSAANLYQYGITTYNEKGEMRSTADIAKQLMGVMTGGRGFSSVEAFNQSLMRGYLGANMATMGFDQAQQEILIQAMRDQVSGRSGDLATAKPVGDNLNTMLTAQGRLNASQTELMMRGEERMIAGFENAADTVEAFNRALLNVVEPLGYLKGYIGGVAGTNVGKGIATAAPSVLSGLKKLGGALMIGGGAALSATSVGAAVGVPLMVGGTALLASGGATSGYGASFNSPTTGGVGLTNALQTAGYGDKNTSGIWSSTNNKHTGQDFAMPVGSTVVAALSGVVSSINPGPDYGTAVVIDHDNGMQTVYGHLSQRDVSLGDHVSTGQRIGKSGDSGNTTGPHLHYEVRKGKNNPVDPGILTKIGGVDPTSAYRESPRSSYLTVGSAGNATGTTNLNADVTSSTASNAVYAGAMGNKEQQKWASEFLTRIGAPTSESNIKALNTWMRAEGKGWSTSLNRATYNPLNTTLSMPGAVSFNKVGVKAYTSWDQGLEATLSTLQGKSAEKRGYTAILNALKTDSGVSAVLGAVNNSAWRTGQTGGAGAYNFPKGGATSGYGTSFSDSSMVERPVTEGTKNIYINVTYDRADGAAALKFAKKVEQYLKNGTTNSAIGAS